MLDRFYFKATHHVGYGEADVKAGKYGGTCPDCNLILVTSDVVCPRCGRTLEVPSEQA